MTKNKSQDFNSNLNLLEEVRVGTPFDVEDAQKIAAMIIGPDGDTCQWSHWDKSCFALFVNVVLHVVYAEPDKTLHGVAVYVENMTDINVAFEKMMQVEHDPDGKYGWKDKQGEPVKVHPVIIRSAKEMYHKADDSTSNQIIVCHSRSFVKPYLDPADCRPDCWPQ